MTTETFTPSRILITGGSGFVGRHLCEALTKRFAQAEILATGSSPEPASPFPWCYQSLDITNSQAVRYLLESYKPDICIHLAAQANVGLSFREEALTWRVNLNGTLNLLAGASEVTPGMLFINAGSSDCYGASFKLNRPISEEDLLQPLNPYAASKSAADLACYTYSQTSDLKIIRARPFNHSGAGQSTEYVIPTFCQQAVAIEQGKQQAIQTGDLSAHRDISHVSDIVAAYTALIEHSDRFENGEAVNIASGEVIQMQDIISQIQNLSRAEIRHALDPTRLRKSDIPLVSSNVEKLKQRTGWQPTKNLQDIIRDVLTHERKA
ncbi:GDP-mannose 4,6-dehydratase [Marinobacterium litorale]|uniref:GDP-mannose 4,6-dehydratase n=1 Tax=Marinobacterium litorale TaxID=404770 RepID=UPI00042A34AB|nr:GDP-mannose 4,6-dehydratase [Marinobacterium litorale]